LLGYSIFLGGGEGQITYFWATAPSPNFPVARRLNGTSLRVYTISAMKIKIRHEHTTFFVDTGAI